MTKHLRMIVLVALTAIITAVLPASAGAWLEVQESKPSGEPLVHTSGDFYPYTVHGQKFWHPEPYIPGTIKLLGLDLPGSSKEQEWICNNGDFTSDALTGPATTLTLNATYEGCKAFGASSWTVSMNTCRYRISDIQPGGSGGFGASAAIVCNAGDFINIKYGAGPFACDFNIPPQILNPAEAQGLHNLTNPNWPSDPRVVSWMEGTGIDVTVKGQQCRFLWPNLVPNEPPYEKVYEDGTHKQILWLW